jgi:hypothetical protein
MSKKQARATPSGTGKELVILRTAVALRSNVISVDERERGRTLSARSSLVEAASDLRPRGAQIPPNLRIPPGRRHCADDVEEVHRQDRRGVCAQDCAPAVVSRCRGRSPVGAQDLADTDRPGVLPVPEAGLAVPEGGLAVCRMRDRPTLSRPNARSTYRRYTIPQTEFRHAEHIRHPQSATLRRGTPRCPLTRRYPVRPRRVCSGPRDPWVAPVLN